MQPRLAYTAAVEVPPSLCQTSKGDGSAYIPISPASRNLVEPSSTIPKFLISANEVVASSTQKSSGQSSTDIIPVYPGDPKDLSTKETTTKEGLTSQQLEASSTTHRDLIMMALPGNLETGGGRHGRNSPPSPTDPTLTNLVRSSAQPIFITIGYNDVQRLPTNSSKSFLDTWYLPLGLVVLFLILLLPAIHLGQACKAKFLAGVQDDYRLQTGEMKGDHLEMKKKEAMDRLEKESSFPFNQVPTPKKSMPFTLSPVQLSPCSSPPLISSSPFSNVDVLSLNSVCSQFSPTLRFEDGAATVITTRAEVYNVMDGSEGKHTPITTGITNFVGPGQFNHSNGCKSPQKMCSVLNGYSKARPTATYDHHFNEASNNETLSRKQKISRNSQRFSSQYYTEVAKNHPLNSWHPVIEGDGTNTSKYKGSTRGSLYTGWGKDGRSRGVRETKSSLARRKVVEMMMATGNVHSDCHYPKGKSGQPYAIT